MHAHFYSTSSSGRAGAPSCTVAVAVVVGTKMLASQAHPGANAVGYGRSDRRYVLVSSVRLWRAHVLCTVKIGWAQVLFMRLVYKSVWLKRGCRPPPVAPCGVNACVFGCCCCVVVAAQSDGAMPANLAVPLLLLKRRDMFQRV